MSVFSRHRPTVFQKTQRELSGFTLIELLIVVAIIGILAAIAVPNFLNAQTRASVSRVMADFRSINTAMKMYFMDNNDYPPDPPGAGAHEEVAYRHLTTPVAYMSSLALFRDHFTEKGGDAGDPASRQNFYEYGSRSWERNDGPGYVLTSFGPDRSRNFPFGKSNGDALAENDEIVNQYMYASSNGLKSPGDIVATQFGVHNK